MTMENGGSSDIFFIKKRPKTSQATKKSNTGIMAHQKEFDFLLIISPAMSDQQSLPE